MDKRDLFAPCQVSNKPGSARSSLQRWLYHKKKNKNNYVSQIFFLGRKKKKNKHVKQQDLPITDTLCSVHF